MRQNWIPNISTLDNVKSHRQPQKNENDLPVQDLVAASDCFGVYGSCSSFAFSLQAAGEKPFPTLAAIRRQRSWSYSWIALRSRSTFIYWQQHGLDVRKTKASSEPKRSTKQPYNGKNLGVCNPPKFRKRAGEGFLTVSSVHWVVLAFSFVQ